METVKISLKRLYRLELNQPINTPVPTPDGGWLINFDQGPEVVRLDEKLNVLWRKDLQVQNEEYVRCRLAISPSNRLMAFAARESIRITDGMGNALYVFTHAPWYSFCGTQAYFSEDSRCLWFVTPNVQEGDDLLHFMDTNTFQIRDRISINNRYCAYHFYKSPQAGKVLIEAAAGQDDCILYVAQSVNGKIVLEELEACEDRIMGSFASSEKEFVTAPHGDGVIKIYSFPFVKEIAAIEQEQIFGVVEEDSEVEEDRLDYGVGYLTDDFIISNSRYGRLLLIDRRTMQLAGDLIPEGYRLKGYDKDLKYTDDPAKILTYEGDINDFYPVDPTRIFIVHGQSSLAVYDTSEVLKMK